MNHVDTHNEKILLQRVAEGDQESYRLLYKKYWDQMFANALHFTKSPELAKDLTQEIFLKIWMLRARLKEVENFESFLYRTAKNMIVDELRRLLRIKSHQEFLYAYFQENSQTSLNNTELKELAEKVEQAISQLPGQMQKAFRLSRFEGLTHEQIASQMGISKVTSQNYIARSLIVIRKFLSANQIETLPILLAALIF
ncbi:MAG TPA: sigma-70 family RNA polymerase sigma factor [Parasegetibacter sp.]